VSRSPILFWSHTVGRTGSCFNAHSDVLPEPHGIAALREPYAAVCCCVAKWDASNPFLLMPVLPRAMRGFFCAHAIEFQNLVPTFVPVRLNSDDGPHKRSNLCTPVVVINVRAPSVRWMIEDKQTAAAIDKIVSRMRDVVDELAFDERRQVLLSIRAISGEIADRLEAPSSRNH